MNMKFVIVCLSLVLKQRHIEGAQLFKSLKVAFSKEKTSNIVEKLEVFSDPKAVEAKNDFCQQENLPNCHPRLPNGNEYAKTNIHGKVKEVGSVPRYEMPVIEAGIERAREAGCEKKGGVLKCPKVHGSLDVESFVKANQWTTSHQGILVDNLKMGQSEAFLRKSEVLAENYSKFVNGEDTFVKPWFADDYEEGTFQADGEGVIVSNDNFVIDGNHRFTGALKFQQESGMCLKPMKAIVINASAKEIIEGAHKTPGMRFQDMHDNLVYQVNDSGTELSKQVLEQALNIRQVGAYIMKVAPLLVTAVCVSGFIATLIRKKYFRRSAQKMSRTFTPPSPTSDPIETESEPDAEAEPKMTN